jgi:hypothetical protein
VSEQLPTDELLNPKGYMVVNSDELAEFEQMVDAHRADGWQLVGGVAVTHGSYEGRKGTESRTQYYQAMVK